MFPVPILTWHEESTARITTYFLQEVSNMIVRTGTQRYNNIDAI